MKLCDADQSMLFNWRVSDFKRLGVAGFLTEFGADSNQTMGLADILELTGTSYFLMLSLVVYM